MENINVERLQADDARRMRMLDEAFPTSESRRAKDVPKKVAAINAAFAESDLPKLVCDWTGAFWHIHE